MQTLHRLDNVPFAYVVVAGLGARRVHSLSPSGTNQRHLYLFQYTRSHPSLLKIRQPPHPFCVFVGVAVVAVCGEICQHVAAPLAAAYLRGVSGDRIVDVLVSTAVLAEIVPGVVAPTCRLMTLLLKNPPVR
jgi:hypothetical protein